MNLPRLWAGLGFQLGVTAADLEDAITKIFQAHHLDLQALIGIATIDRKQGSAILLEVAQAWSLELQFFSAAQLNARLTPNPSQTALIQVQAWSVAEAAALITSCGKLIVPKQIYRTPAGLGITVAIGQSNSSRVILE